MRVTFFKLIQFRFRPFTLLDRYLFRQFAGPFMIAIGGFALIGIVDILMYLVDLAISQGIPVFVTFRLLLYKLPAIMVLFFPMAVLFAVMLVLIRMAKDNELTILQASGVMIGRILAPLLLLSVLVAGISYITNEKVVPWTNRVSDTLIRREITKKPILEVAENVIFKVPGDRYFYIKSVDPLTTTLRGIFIFEEGPLFPRITTAKLAHWTKKSWTLEDGAIYEVNDNGHLEFFDHFKKATIHVDQELSAFYEQHKSPKEMNSAELQNKIQILSNGGINTRTLQVELALKKSIPIACLIFGMIGIAFCLTFVRTGKDWWGVIVAICAAVLVVGFYFFIVAIFRALANDGHLTPFLGAWIPNLAYGFVGGSVILYQSFFK